MDSRTAHKSPAGLSEPLFQLRNVVKTRSQGPGYALAIPYLRIEYGERLAITGPSGCGKSTALDILGMVLAPDIDVPGTGAQCIPEPGAATFPGQNGEGLFTFRPLPSRFSSLASPLVPLKPGGDAAECLDVLACWRQGRRDRLAAARLAHVGYVLQTGGLLPFLSVRENMQVTASVLKNSSRSDLEDRTQQVATSLGIARLLDAMPSRLSIGERQRVAIGRALLPAPSLVLADEPTAALDPHHADVVLDLFLDAVARLGATLIMVTHDRRIVERGKLHEVPMRVESLADGSSQAVLESLPAPGTQTGEAQA